MTLMMKRSLFSTLAIGRIPAYPNPVGTPILVEIKRAARRMALSMKTRDLVCHPDPRDLP
jgi:hypothetical protein